MFHLNDRTLERLVNGAASTAEVDRIQRHVEECRACSRRLEEWRDNFSEVDRHYPMLAQAAAPVTASTPGGIVLVPPSEARRSPVLDLANILWGVAGVLAIVVLYGLTRQLPKRADPRDGVAGFSYQEPRTESTDTGQLAARTPPRPPLAAPDTVPDASLAVADTAAPALPPLPTSRGFTRVAEGEAARRLKGPVRRLGGLAAEHFEIAPATAVPGAQRNLDVIRVVYRDGETGRVTLDQQLIPVDESGFRPIEDPALESGQTIFRAGPNGTTTAIWLDESGYRLALSARASQDSLRRLVARVQ